MNTDNSLELSRLRDRIAELEAENSEMRKLLAVRVEASRLDAATERIAVLEAERDEISLTLANSQAHNLELRDRITALEELRAHIVRQYDANLDSGLRLAEQLEVAQKELEAVRETSECRCGAAAAVSLDLDECRRELDQARERTAAGHMMVAHLSDVLIWHRDPESADYNECEKNPCNFCEEAGKAIAKWNAA